MVDAGKSVINGAGRTRADMAGRGYNVNLNAYAEQEMYRLFPEPTPKRYMYTAFWHDASKKGLQEKTDALRLHFKRVSTLIVKYTS